MTVDKVIAKIIWLTFVAHPVYISLQCHIKIYSGIARSSLVFVGL